MWIPNATANAATADVRVNFAAIVLDPAFDFSHFSYGRVDASGGRFPGVARFS